ncbi:MAG: 6-pyruvoyl tetrahydrobiopterin synthase [Verrucomicrobia bacterium]|jgi:6-pyruvoyltetrahydropterin/6-carboxytetrahydropterin synthase|nr:6-pyruvoyl tetrahydrobiopterin synthase [Verrucomicrobiota bacterium]
MLTEIHLAKENFKFSAGHFTIFSATERENLHGHNFTAGVTIQCEVLKNGMTFDYGLAKRAMETLCRSLNETFLLPANSPHLRIQEVDDHLFAIFADEKIPFLRRDATLLPLENVTVEELARWFLDQFIKDFASEPAYRIRELAVEINSGPGQGATMRRHLA